MRYIAICLMFLPVLAFDTIPPLPDKPHNPGSELPGEGGGSSCSIELTCRDQVKISCTGPGSCLYEADSCSPRIRGWIRCDDNKPKTWCGYSSC